MQLANWVYTIEFIFIRRCKTEKRLALLQILLSVIAEIALVMSWVIEIHMKSASPSIEKKEQEIKLDWV